ncbi:diguanylate cyclase [Planomonospora sp. ID67723]|uniref:GGDEF domain-containing protein n=1 Tax=Planomonospora sp. ID67723 TaxID=2738134 RepID=UPI0018C3C9B8|nr:diguanylate cyclase [Planomonospora sp. ID67723]MBG0832589.1 diguanylate cyclase [Planomonospora sp. ID67723]
MVVVFGLVAVFGLAALVAASVAAVGWRRQREAPVFGVLTFFALGVAAWAVSDVVNLLVADPGQALLWGSLFIPAESVVVIGFFFLASAVMDRTWRLPWRTAALLAVEPAIVVFLLATNPWHHLFFAGVERVGWQGELVLQLGPLYWAHIAYSYLVLIAGMIRVERVRRKIPRGQRRIYNWTLGTVLPPTVINLVGLPLENQIADLTSIGFVFSVIIAYRMVAHPTLPEQIPVARRQVFDTLADAVVVADRSGRILDHNAAARRLVERVRPALESGLTGAPVTEVFGRDVPMAEDAVADQVLVGVGGSGVDLHLRTSPLRDRRGNCIGWALTAHDITEANRLRRQVEEANTLLREQVVRDALTGLYNRRHLTDMLPALLTGSIEGETPLSLAVVDIDHFKRVNDTYGHASGDAVLIRVAQILATSVRYDDLVARLGGEEFVIVLPGMSPEAARTRLEKLRESVAAAQTRTAGHQLSVTVSIGAAAFDGEQTATELLEAADEALYTAKRLGRDRVEQAVPRPGNAGPSSAATRETA